MLRGSAVLLLFAAGESETKEDKEIVAKFIP
jgi:hypothetical protein